MGDPEVVFAIEAFVAEKRLKKSLLLVEDATETIKTDLIDNVFRGQRLVVYFSHDHPDIFSDRQYHSPKALAAAIRDNTRDLPLKLIADLRHVTYHDVAANIKRVIKLKELAASKLVTLIIVDDLFALQRLPQNLLKRLELTNGQAPTYEAIHNSADQS